MKQKPLVSIIIPAYNAVQWVGRAIESALAQDWPRTEIIVVNDGSTDATEDVCLRYKENIRYLRQSNYGVSAARNAGIQIARGEFIGFLDADDEYLPHMVSTLAEALLAFPTAGAASGAFIHRTPQGIARRPPTGAILGPGKNMGLVNDFFRLYARYPLVWTGSVLVRRAVFDALGLFRTDLRLGEDQEMWCRIAGNYPWVFVDQEVAIYNNFPGSSITLKPLVYKQHNFSAPLYSEDEMKRIIRPEHYVSYRYFRRERTLSYCKTLLRYGEVHKAREALRKAWPAPLNWEYLIVNAFALLPPAIGQSIVRGAAAVKRSFKHFRIFIHKAKIQ